MRVALRSTVASTAARSITVTCIAALGFIACKTSEPSEPGTLGADEEAPHTVAGGESEAGADGVSDDTPSGVGTAAPVDGSTLDEPSDGTGAITDDTATDDSATDDTAPTNTDPDNPVPDDAALGATDDDLAMATDDAGAADIDVDLAAIDASKTVVCLEYFFTRCERLVECSSDGTADLAEACRGQGEDCPDQLFGSGAVQTVEDIAACTAEWAMATCEQLSTQAPTCVATTGSKALHELCSSDDQCASGNCYGPTRVCGVCTAEASAADDCRLPHYICPDELYCDPDDGSCVADAPVLPEDSDLDPENIGLGLGEPCQVDHDCVDALYCHTSPGGGTCSRAPRLGEDCSQYDSCSNPDPEITLYCDAETLLCTQSPSLGQPCGIDSDGNPQCDPVSACRFDVNPAGECGERPQVGEPCAIRVDRSNFWLRCADGATCEPELDVPTCRVAEEGEPTSLPVPVYGTPRAAGEDCFARVGCEPPYDCIWEGPGRGRLACGERALPGEPCTEPHQLCHRGSECKGGVCLPIESQGLFEATCLE